MWLLILVFVATLSASAQTHTTVRHHQEQVTDESAVDFNRAQDAIAKGDFTTARTLLQGYTTKNPDDYRGWYTLAYADSGAKDSQAAIADYKKALTIKPDLFEANLNLGLLLAQTGDREAALPLVQKATTETPSAIDPAERNKALANAWDALGRLSSGDAAKQAYEKALALDPQDEAAKQGLAALNAPARPAKAATAEELEQMHAKEPGNAAVAAQLGQKYVEANEFAKAEPLVKQVVTSNPNDASANYRYGWLLMRLQRPHAAEQYLIRTLQLDPKLTDAYGDLAIAAADNQDYVLSLKVLDTRAKYLPENAGTYFLRATNLDHLQQVKPAAIMYRKYLAVAKGESPDNEWRAKHRIIALDPKNETKGKENN